VNLVLLLADGRSKDLEVTMLLGKSLLLLQPCTVRQVQPEAHPVRSMLPCIFGDDASSC